MKKQSLLSLMLVAFACNIASFSFDLNRLESKKKTLKKRNKKNTEKETLDRQEGGKTKKTDTHKIRYEQSPIDLSEKMTSKEPTVSLTINYTDQENFKIKYNSYGVTCKPSSNNQSVSFQGKDYRLVEYHFHYPSEYTIDGHYFDATVHFVHKADDGELLALGFFIRQGMGAVVAPIMKNGKIVELQKKASKGVVFFEKLMEACEKKEALVSLNPMDIVQKNLSFFHLKGSLTTPAYDEGVLWFVFKQPIDLSPYTMKQLRTLIGKENSRPIQHRIFLGNTE